MTVVFFPIGALLELVPVVSWPVWFQTSGSGSVVSVVDSWGDSVGSIAGWFPVAAFFDAGAIVLVVGAASLAIRFMKVLVSLVTGGGGSV